MRTETAGNIQRQRKQAKGASGASRARHPAVRGGRIASRKFPERGLRARVAGAFRKMANGAEPSEAQKKTNAFYRSSGHAWAKDLR